MVNCSLDYSRAITASANLLTIYLLLLLLCSSGYIRATQLNWCHLDAPSVEKTANVTLCLSLSMLTAGPGHTHSAVSSFNVYSFGFANHCYSAV